MNVILICYWLNIAPTSHCLVITFLLAGCCFVLSQKYSLSSIVITWIFDLVLGYYGTYYHVDTWYCCTLIVFNITLVPTVALSPTNLELGLMEPVHLLMLASMVQSLSAMLSFSLKQRIGHVHKLLFPQSTLISWCSCSTVPPKRGDSKLATGTLTLWISK